MTRSAAIPLIDPFARRVKDLRISITDRCNFRCTYCMPEEGMQWLDRSEVLSYEELARVAEVCVRRWDFEAIRVTGGEPLIRAHVVRLVEMLARLDVDVALTTNGVKLAELAHDLAAAGLDRVNVSLDSLRRERFLALTRRDEIDRVLAGIDAALDAGLTPVKVNAVVIRGVNDDEVVDLAEFGRQRGVGMRFIEFMPLDGSGEWTRDRVVPASEILERINAVHPLRGFGSRADGGVERSTASGRETKSGGMVASGVAAEPAQRWEYADGIGDVGVIPTVTEPFCDNCDRIRITAEGRLRTCLFAIDETDLRAELRAPGGLAAADLDERLAAAITGAVGTKWAGHSVGQVNFVRPARSMSQIGG